MNEPTDKEQYLSVADQCAATASNDITALILVDGGSGTLRQLLNDAADAIRAGWRAQPTAEGGIKWQCGPLASGFTAPHPAARAPADSQPAKVELFNPLEGGNLETELQMAAVIALRDSQPAPVLGTIAHVGTGKTTLTGAITSALRAASTEADSMTAPASGEVAGWLPVHSNGHKFYGAPLKTEAEAKQYINQVHQSSDSVTLIVRPFTWIATPPRWQTS